MADSVFTDLLIHTVTVSRRSLSTRDEWNVASETFSTISTTMTCLIQDTKENIEIDRRGKKEMVQAIGFFEYGSNVVEDDIITYNTQKYQVIGIDNAAGQAHHLEVYLRIMEN